MAPSKAAATAAAVPGGNASSQHQSRKRKLSATNTPTTTAAPTKATRSDAAGAKSIISASTKDQDRSKSKKQQGQNQNPTSKRKPQPPRPSVPYTLATATALPSDDADGQRALRSLEKSNKSGGEYAVQIQSVLSSSKMQKKVASVLRHLSGPAAGGEGGAGEEVSQPENLRVVVLRAKACDAGKLVSIAEIAKREIEKSGGRGGVGGTWYQYVSVGEELEQRERAGPGHTSVVEESVVDGGSGRDENDADEEGGDDDEDDFEIMKTRFERAIEGKPLVRGVPVMALFLSRAPLDELRRRFGEQTNAPP
ncbi:hypothetical protein Micbo1qcDRAFT_230408 [Microdochium bolleyi]|uniref:DNA/RNA-binding protein Alba-like domain-containing protein n=1 Tax=Microdochium bolleyi TaxID=196109 RepID=A0A136JD45_9PEZI|nr:hypothetical protein Micbo1qcDRAFT_230408 [Microdochium bolleyi]